MNVRRFAPRTAVTDKPQFLVVVDDGSSLQRLPAAAARARRINARLLVALAQRRIGFTTDAAVARSAARRTDEALLNQERQVHRVLRGSGVDWTSVRMPFRDSASATRRARRLAAAAGRLCRRREIAPLPPSDSPGSLVGPEQPPVPAGPRAAIVRLAVAGPPVRLLAQQRL